jgi:hypothetical protein
MNKHTHDNEAPTAADGYPVAGAGVSIDTNDKNGNPIHIGDTLMFDEEEWGGVFEPYVVEIKGAEIQLCGVPSDLPQFCEIVKRWDQTE